MLWTFNLCIHDEVTGKGHMYMWSENMASRGADEIGSCVMKHLQTYVVFIPKKFICIAILVVDKIETLKLPYY